MNPLIADEIPEETAKRLVVSKDHFWDCLNSKLVFLPSKKSRICTLEYLGDVRTGAVFSLKYADVRLLPVHKAPSVSVLQHEFMTELGGWVWRAQQKGSESDR